MNLLECARKTALSVGRKTHRPTQARSLLFPPKLSPTGPFRPVVFFCRPSLFVGDGASMHGHTTRTDFFVSRRWGRGNRLFFAVFFFPLIPFSPTTRPPPLLVAPTHHPPTLHFDSNAHRLFFWNAFRSTQIFWRIRLTHHHRRTPPPPTRHTPPPFPTPVCLFPSSHSHSKAFRW